MTHPVEASTRRQEILTGVIVLGLSVGGFALGEIAVRVLQLVKYGVETSVEESKAFYKESATGLRLIRPNRKLGKVRINNLGFRGPDIDASNSKQTLRLLFLGSSTTYDAASPEGENWPHRTVDLLRASISGCDMDFINAGQPGYGTKEMSNLYETHLRQLDADVVIVLPGDVNSDLDRAARSQGIDTVHYRPTWLARHSVLWGKLETNFRIVELQRRALSDVGKLKPDFETLAAGFGERLISLEDKITADGALFCALSIGSQMRTHQSKKDLIKAGNTNLFYMPYVSLPDLLRSRIIYNLRIKDLAREHEFVHLESSLRIPGDRNHYSDTMHFTVAGSGEMAKELSAELLANPRFADFVTSKGCRIGE